MNATEYFHQEIEQAWAGVLPEPSSTQKEKLKTDIKALLQQKQATIVAHYYVHPDLQDLAEESGGCVADSLEMARFGKIHSAQTLVVCGVRFMAETAKILSPEKKVLVLDQAAQCSLDLGCNAEEFSHFCQQHPEREVVVYANTSAEVKALSDWVVTSSIAVELIEHLHQQNKSIIWAPDKHLGHYLQQKTGCDILLWDGACIVHEEFKAQSLQHLKQMHPEAKILVHPESPQSVIALADVVGSTSQLLRATVENTASVFIVATDQGILHKMRQRQPDKTFLMAPTAGDSATCKSCGACPWMALNSLEKLHAALKNPEAHQVLLDERTTLTARQPIEKMLAFSAQLRA